MGVEKVNSRAKADTLRHRAEDLLIATPPSGPGLFQTDAEMQRTLHELQVHQIELTMQNLELDRAREEAEKSREQYTDLYEFAPVGYLTLDRDAIVRAANLTGADLLRMERSRLLGRPFGQFIAAKDRTPFASFLVEIFCSRGDEACEVALMVKGDLTIIVQVVARVDSSGQECRLALIDMTERRRAEDAARESEERVYCLAEMAIDAIIMLDELGVVTFCNAAAQRMFGCSGAEIMSQDFYKHFIPERFFIATKEGFTRFREQGSGPIIGKMTEVMAHRKDGTEFLLEVSISVRKLQGKCHAIGIMRDITERKNLEAQLLQSKKMESVGLLAGGIAHDINNILSVIAGYGSITEINMQEADPLRNYQRQIIAAADRGAKLTRSLLDFSREQPINPQPVEVHTIINNMGNFIAMVAGAGIRLEITCDDQILTVAAGNGQLEQILTNLASNARHAMPGGGTLSIVSGPMEIDAEFISLHGFGKPGRFVLISVTDTGIGMDAATAKRIFEPFFTTRAPGEGTGLGLSLVYSIIRQHGGFIDVRSEPGNGTSFMVYLPLIDSNAAPEELAGPSPAQGGTETILLAEDDEPTLLITSKVLEEFGYRVITATDGEDAIEKFRANRDSIRLLLLDVVMPYRNGKDAYDEIRKICPAARGLFMSCHSTGILKEISFEAGTELIKKPFSPLYLKRRVREMLDEELSDHPCQALKSA